MVYTQLFQRCNIGPCEITSIIPMTIESLQHGEQILLKEVEDVISRPVFM